MKYVVRTGLFLGILTGIIFSQSVSLTGTITGSDGKGIEGVVVSLVNMSNLTATSDADGKFAITMVSIKKNLMDTQERPSFKISGNRLIIPFLLPEKTGNVEIFSGDGRRLTNVPISGKDADKQSAKLPQLASGIYLIRISLGMQSYSYTLMSYGTTRKTLTTHSSGTRYNFTTVGALQQETVDTITASKDGYIEQRVAIDSYEKENIVIVLQKEEEPIGDMPLVYEEEFTGADCEKPDLVDDPRTLPEIEHLPDPFLMADGETHMTTKAQWRCRRAEIHEMISKYGMGHKPPKPEAFEANLSGNKINITCGVGGTTINLSATVSRPSGAPDEPIPAIINKASLRFDFKSRGIAEISINESDIVSSFFSGGFSDGNFHRLYPNTDAGYMVRAAWLISRIIDALEMLPEANIDTRHLAVSGCSYGGKIALYSGALDERIALTIPHESGGGGTISWRYSDMLEDRDNTEVENLHHAQGAAWYSDALRIYQPTNVSPNTLPYDHHELMGLCLPRALFCIESSMIARMGGEAARVDALAVRRMYEAFGISDRFGVTEDNVNHCSWSSNYNAGLTAFVDKFLLGKDDVDTDYLESTFQNVDEAKWIPWDAPELN